MEPGGVKLSRQLTGASIKTLNAIEAEVSRLGLEIQEIYPRTGDPKANRLILKQMGPLAEKLLMPMVQSEGYRQADDAAKRVMLTRMINRIRTDAEKLAAAQDPETFAPIRTKRRIGRRERELLESKGVKLP